MIHYEERGNGPAVVLLHGGAMDLRMWDDQVPALAERHRVIRFDARGHAMVHRFAERTKGELMEIGGSAHMPNMERPADVNQALLEFLAQ